MNITDYIVEYLAAGHAVELPGLGSLTPSVVEAHFEADSATFYPTQKVIEFSATQRVGNGVVTYIAERECVSLTTAEQLWRNYMDALQGKLRGGAEHVLPGIGSLHLEQGECRFAEEGGQAEGGRSLHRQPLKNVRLYNPSDNYDPFAVFELTEYREESEADFEDSVEPTVPESLPEEEKAAPELENTAEEEGEDVVEKPMAEEAEVTTEAATAAEENEVTEEAGAEEEPKPAAEEVPDATEPEPEAEAVVPENTQQVAPTADEAEPVAEEKKTPTKETAQEEEAQRLASVEALQSLNDMEQLPQQPTSKEGGKKRRKGWIWIVLLLLVLLLAGAAYYYLTVYKPKQTQPAETSKLNIEEMITNADDSSEDAVVGEASAQGEADETGVATASVGRPSFGGQYLQHVNIFTLSTDNIAFSDAEVNHLGGEVASYLSGYIRDYLQQKRYSKAYDAMMGRVEDYATKRLGDLLSVEGFHVQDLLTYKDYVRNYCYDAIKTRKGTQNKFVVQRELMEQSMLNRLLDEVLNEQSIEPDAVAKAAPATKAAVPTAASQSQSKRGFDIIAGFYVNRSSANSMAAQLKKKGCDAYIIDKNGLYYVSMGSASSRTQAEALYKHIKEWYKGDVAIKEW
ncbi:MAG: SPOR domain-containing protein [Bacteroidales bacterium]|nr:SPOR domain-containing protein [Bacteroidales bacterium]